MKLHELSADAPKCDAPSPASPTLGGVRFKCSLLKGHDRPLPVEDWAHCATCGGTSCKGIANGSNHRFAPTVTGYTYRPHRFWVEWPSGPPAARGVTERGENR